MMGSDEGQGEPDEHPRHKVAITRPFYLGIHELTQAQYEAVMGQNPSYFSPTGEGKAKIAGASTDAHPVERVSWTDAVQFCNKLSEREGLRPFYEIDGENVTVLSWSGEGYRLPTEAEWEYASRGDPVSLAECAWYDNNSEDATHPVGQKLPNQLGLHDMLGNVNEWCWDGYGAEYYKQSPSDDPRGPSGATRRVIRGGGWLRDPRYCRSADRDWRQPVVRGLDLGFRVARGQSQR
jgi:formylglycine-generating enzyme required for sulfatase activity